RPSDVDFIVLLKTKRKDRNKKWSVDLVIAPDNNYGKSVEKDAIKWTKQKYGKENVKIIKIK
ncbi:MAG: hypothetical protein WCK90_05715, partial [archaeon]